jgi:hypothetical protein
MNEKPKDFYRVFAPGVPDVRVVSERFTREADAKRLKREILMAYPAATVRIERTDDEGRAKYASLHPVDAILATPSFANPSVPLIILG